VRTAAGRHLKVFPSPSPQVLPFTAMSDPRSEVLCKLARLALLNAALKEVLAPFETQVAALQKGMSDAAAPSLREIETLEEVIKHLGADHPDEVFGQASTVKLNNLSLGIRRPDKVELTAAEEDVFSVLEKLATTGDDAQRLAAKACLRIEKTLNKVFIREMYEESPEWFEALGITVKESVSISLTEVKPPKTKVTKEKKSEPEG
jgi:hypothetical protein